MRYFLELAFLGAKYSGWQVQPNAPSVQAELEKALALRFGTPVKTIGAGRTDAGVNAFSMMVHIDLPEGTTYEREQWRRSLNGILPHDISIRTIYPVQEGAHARFDATGRTYRYFIAHECDPFNRWAVLPVRPFPNIELMNEAARFFLGTHDFSSFCRTHSDSKTPFCTITEASWYKAPYPQTYFFQVRANRFLRNMVRAMVGTLLWVGQKKIAASDVTTILEAKTRAVAGPSVPGEPLFLWQVDYPKELFLLHD